MVFRKHERSIMECQSDQQHITGYEFIIGLGHIQIVQCSIKPHPPFRSEQHSISACIYGAEAIQFYYAKRLQIRFGLS